MRNYRPASWSQQAREWCDRQIDYINNGNSFIDEVVWGFGWSQRNNLIKYRAAKRFGRMRRNGKVHENLELYRQRMPDAELLLNHTYNPEHPLPKYLREE